MLAGGAELELRCQEEGRPQPPPLTLILQLGCPRQDHPETTVTGLLKPERFPGIGAATGSRGQLEALIPVPPSPIEAQNRSSFRVDDSESTPRVRQRPGGAMLYASRLHTLMHKSAEAKGGPQPLAAGRTSAGSGIGRRRGHGPSVGGPLQFRSAARRCL